MSPQGRFLYRIRAKSLQRSYVLAIVHNLATIELAVNKCAHFFFLGIRAEGLQVFMCSVLEYFIVAHVPHY